MKFVDFLLGNGGQVGLVQSGVGKHNIRLDQIGLD